MAIISAIVGGFFKSSLAKNDEFSLLYYSLDNFSKIDICKNEIITNKLFSVPYNSLIDDAKISKDCKKIVFDLCEYNRASSDLEREYIHSLWLLDIGKSEFIRLSSESSDIKNIDFYLPDNENIIIFSVEENNRSLIYTIDYDGLNLKSITPLYKNSIIEWIEVSQRNKKLVYAVKEENRERIFIVNFDGADLYEIPINCEETKFARYISPDENYLLFSGRVEDKDTLYLVDISKGNIKEIVYQPVFSISWSWDSSKFAFVVNMGENYNYSNILYSYNLTNESKTLLTPRYRCIENVTWYKDNENIYYIACYSDNKSAIRVASFDGKNHYELLKNYAEIREFQFSPDYKQIAFIGKKSSVNDDEILLTVSIKNPEKELVLFKCIEFEYFNWFPDSERLIVFAKEEKGRIRKVKIRKDSEYYSLFKTFSDGDTFEYEDNLKVFSHILLLNCQNISYIVDKKAEFKYRDIHIIKEYVPLGLIPPKISVKFPSSDRLQKIDFSNMVFMLVTLILILLVVLLILLYSRKRID